MSNEQTMAWTVFGIWNDMIYRGEDRVLEPRDHIWASEIGKAPVDVFLAMKAVPFTNPPNIRSRRKFIAGDFWEWFFVRLMQMAGIYLNTQEHLKHQYPGLLEVTGRLDIFAGGTPDFEKARFNITQGQLVDWFGQDGFGKQLQNTMLAIVDHLEKDYAGKDLKKLVIEVKSCSSFMFDKYERTGKASPNHVWQLFHYLKSKGLDEGHILYICKDDCRVMEFGVFNPSPAEDEYKAFIKVITDYHSRDEQPPLEPMVIYDPDDAKFFKNWKVEYSQYLTMLYGFETPDDYRKEWEGQVASMNRVFKRCVNGDKMTAGNLEVIGRVKATIFPQWDDLVADAIERKEAGALSTIEEEVSEYES